jgi:hypothetical protein
MRRMMLAMSQEKVGNALGLSFQQVQKYEKGTKRPDETRKTQMQLQAIAGDTCNVINRMHAKFNSQQCDRRSYVFRYLGWTHHLRQCRPLNRAVLVEVGGQLILAPPGVMASPGPSLLITAGPATYARGRPRIER